MKITYVSVGFAFLFFWTSSSSAALGCGDFLLYYPQAKGHGDFMQNYKTRLTKIKSKNKLSAGVPALVVLPGGPGLGSYSLQGLEGLSADFDLFMVDPSGTWPGSFAPTTYDEMLFSIEEALKEISGPVVLIGHSSGARYAADLAIRGNVQVAKLVFLSGLLTVSGSEQLIKNYETEKTEALTKAELAYRSSPSDKGLSDWFMEYGRLFFTSKNEQQGRLIFSSNKLSSQSFLNLRTAITPTDEFELLLAATTIPKLFIGANEDKLILASSAEQEARRYNSEFRAIEGASHFMNLDQPELLVKAITEFVLKQ